MVAFRRLAVFLVVTAMGLAACGGDDEGDAGVTVSEGIGAPEPAPLEPPPSVAKSARVEMEVARSGLTDAAQAVVDLATSDRVGGFLASSIVDLEEGYGSATILVQVPAARFEETVARLGDLGDVTRQEMAGQAVPRGATRKERARVDAHTAFAPIDVALDARRPPAPRRKPALERSLETATGISLAILSAAIVGAGVALPVGALLLLLWLAWAVVIRRLRLRWDQPA